MKRASKLILFVLSFIACFFPASLIYAADDVSVYLDGKEVSFDVPPCIINGRTMVPVRGVLEAAGANVTWDGVARMTVASMNGTVVWIGVDNTQMLVQKDGKSYNKEFDVAPCIIDGRTLVPIKHVAEAFGINVGWNSEKRQVILSREFEVSSSPNVITLSGFTPPAKTTVGSPYSISGSIISDGVIDRFNIKITDLATGRVQINETQYNINKKEYSLGEIDARIKFGTLSVGNKLMEITAVTKNETRKTFSYNFEVARPVGAQIDGEVSMLWPVPSSGLLTTIFWCDNEFCHSNGGRVRGHAALDIAAAENADVISVKDGTVIEAGFGDAQNGYTGYGNFIVVDHGDGITTQYSHLYSIYVSVGDTVTAGQVIGGVGNTGNSTGNHLDFCIEKNNERCDPLYYIDMHPQVRCYEECDKPFFEEAMKKRGITITQ